MTVNPADIQGLPGEGESVGNAMMELLQDLAEGGGGGGQASDVTVDPAVEGETNVQDALEALASGGSQPGATYKVDAIFNEPSVAVPYPITAVDQGEQTFEIAGDHASAFLVGDTFRVIGSTGNDGIYTVVSAVFATATTLTVVEAITDATADGHIPQRLVAQVDVAAGETVLGVWLYPLVAPWDRGNFSGGDSDDPFGYFNDLDLSGGLTDPYDPTNVSLGTDFEISADNSVGFSPSFAPPNSVIGGGGVLYPAGDTLTFTVDDIRTGGEGGELLVRVVLMSASTAVVAA